MREVLLYFSLLYKGDFNRIYKAVASKEKVDENKFKELKKNLKSQYITIIDEDYPKKLKCISAPPFVLYYYGDLSLCDKESVAMIGKRQASLYGLNKAKEISTYLMNNQKIIVSGLAKGIDGASHQAVLKQKGKTIAVLGCGIDYCYPIENLELYKEIKQNHLLVSEYPDSEMPQKDYFKRRNRIIAGLSDKVVVVEANKKSGTMITVGYALEQGKEIFCVPGRNEENLGCNYLIYQGANILLESKDLL